MNEPSVSTICPLIDSALLQVTLCMNLSVLQVFSGPEVTMDKDAIHFGGIEHREVSRSVVVATLACFPKEFDPF